VSREFSCFSAQPIRNQQKGNCQQFDEVSRLDAVFSLLSPIEPVFEQDRFRQAPGGVQPLSETPVGREGYCGASTHINASLKSWLDNVIIPNLIKWYLSEQGEPKAAQEASEHTLAGSGKRLYTRPVSERKQ
jgi:hypothetical protein